MTKDNDLIKKTAEDLFEKMDIKDVVVKVEEQENSPILILNVQAEESSGQLIGQGGANLNDFQRILRLLVAKKDLEAPSFLLDINDYRKKREQFLKEFAQESAEQAVKTKSTSTLQPMSSYERRIIHVELAERKDVETESTGEEPERRVVIKPIS